MINNKSFVSLLMIQFSIYNSPCTIREIIFKMNQTMHLTLANTIINLEYGTSRPHGIPSRLSLLLWNEAMKYLGFNFFSL